MTAKPPVRPRTRPLLFGRATTATEPEAVRALKAFGSRQIGDPFAGSYGTPVAGTRTIMEPTFNLLTLLRLPMENAVLGPCIDAMVTNVVGHGYQLTYIGPRGEETSAEAQTEKTALSNLLEVPNGDLSLQATLERVQRDKETIGTGYLEVGRNAKAEVVLMAHVPGHTLRMTSRDAEPVEIETQVRRGGNAVTLKAQKRFRRFVQLVGERRVYFKEFGDPRLIDPATGDENPKLAHEESATEILAFTFYSPGHIYGLPRWLGQLTSVLGGRQAELTNLDFFLSNAVPAMALLVSGGLVSEDSITELENTFTAARGRASQNRIAIIEVAGADDPAAPGGILAPRVEMVPLHGERQDDAVFSGYEKASEQKIRSAFRLPPLLTGHSQDHKHASAQTAFEVADSQVFGPERAKVEAVLNGSVLATLQPVFWKLTLRPPRITTPAALVSALDAFGRMGALTPNTAVQIANAQLGLDLKPTNEPWGNAPMLLSTALLKANRLKGVEKIVTSSPSRR